jgi:hypothetical protein
MPANDMRVGIKPDRGHGPLLQKYQKEISEIKAPRQPRH